MIRQPGWPGSSAPPPSVPGGNYPATTTPPTRSAPNPPPPGHPRRLARGPGRLGPVDGPDIRGLPDGTLLHLRDTYPIETGWAPQWTGEELRQVRLAAADARLAAIRTSRRSSRRPPPRSARNSRSAAGPWRPAIRPCTTPTASARPSSPPSWPTGSSGSTATRQQRQLAVAADAELHRRHPGQQFPPLRSGEPESATPARAGGTHPDGGDRHSAARPVDRRPGRAAPRLRRQAG